MGHIHTITRLIEVLREYKRPLCHTFNDSKKAFDSVDIEAVMEVLDIQGVPTQYTKILRWLYRNFITKISPFYDDINIYVKRGVGRGDTISPNYSPPSFENVKRSLEWDNMGVKNDGQQLQHLRFPDNIVVIIPNISQAERMLDDFDKACGKIGLRPDNKQIERSLPISWWSRLLNNNTVLLDFH
ncbi:unnamed protein product [Angiostrongylus costaricensis]|uniref:Reverse transcriptase domain-containing protein n=1 Tax=Angiostrongylus costaricensis TaxID=334426 RepID=A0A0R3PUA1_ANGCS|nr:unnamed protein product [Angiostrongylus costaricensis]